LPAIGGAVLLAERDHPALLPVRPGVNPGPASRSRYPEEVKEDPVRISERLRKVKISASAAMTRRCASCSPKG